MPTTKVMLHMQIDTTGAVGLKVIVAIPPPTTIIMTKIRLDNELRVFIAITSTTWMVGFGGNQSARLG
jgi:hypothetical protein